LPEVADTKAINDLVDAYAHCADRRDAAGQMALFTEDADFIVYADRGSPVPTQRLRGRAALAPMCHQLNAYQMTTHLNSQCTTRIDGIRASGVTCCLIHQLKIEGTACMVTIASIRYLDSFVKRDSTWLIRQRQVLIDWTETRTLTVD
jgi:ketosteroid isomerase-like protein